MRLNTVFNQIIFACLLCILGSTGVLHAESQTAKPTGIAADATKVYWPMMRGESVQDLAKTLYPESPILRKRFIDKTRSMSHSILPDLDVNKRFAHAQMIVIPNEQAVRELTHKIQRYQDVVPETNQEKKQKLNFSYSLNNPPPVPTQSYQYAKKAPVKQPQENTAVAEAPKTSPVVTPVPETPAIPEKQAIKLPEVKAPTVKVPEIKLPEVNIPEIKTDALKKGLHNFWYRLSTGFQNLTKKTGDFLLQLKADAGVFLAKYKGKDIQAIFNDYHLRNGLLLGLLALLGIVLLVMSKRHTKAHAQSLDALADTIRPIEDTQKEPEISEPVIKETERKEPTIELAAIDKEPITSEPSIQLDTEQVLDEINSEIPTLNNKTVEVNIAKPQIEQPASQPETTQTPNVDQPAVAPDPTDVKPVDPQPQTANVLVESKEQLEGLVKEADLDFIIDELTTKQPPSNKK